MKEIKVFNYIEQLKRDKDELIKILKECDEAMEYISEWNLPINLPNKVKEVIKKFESKWDL